MGWFRQGSNNKHSRTRHARPQLEILEDRVVPSGTPIDLTQRDSSEEVGDAVFAQSDYKPAGTGAINSFLRVQGHGKKADGIEQGHNTDARPLDFDEKKGKHTRALQLGDIGVVNIGGELYREFLLDINEPGAKTKSLVSLDELKIFLGDSPDAIGFDEVTGLLEGTDLVYDLDGDGDFHVLLNGKLNPGSGKADAIIYIKDSLFSEGDDDSYVTLYSKFGETEAAQGGFEEWAARETPFTQDLGSISGTVFEDADESGVQESGELGVGGLTVFLDANNDGALDAGEQSTTTGTDGSYSFSGLVTGLGELSTFHVFLLEIEPDEFDVTTENPLTIELDEPGEIVDDADFGIVSTIE